MHETRELLTICDLTLTSATSEKRFSTAMLQYHLDVIITDSVKSVVKFSTRHWHYAGTALEKCRDCLGNFLIGVIEKWDLDLEDFQK